MTQQNDQLYAALDLGSNSFHLIIARLEQDNLTIIDRHKEMVRLASGLNEEGKLTEPAMEKALEALGRFAERIRPIPAEFVRVIGTNTLRAAKNSNIFLRKAEKILGVSVNIISGVEEARLIYLGTSKDVSPNTNRLVMDIGGGSTELIVGRNEPIKLESLYMGCVSFSRKYFADGIISKKSYHKAVLAARSETQDSSKSFTDIKWSEAIGCSGTIKAIAKVITDLGLAESHTITPDSLDELANQVIECKTIDNLSQLDIDESRRPVFVGGLAILHGVFQELGIENMHASSHTIREGIIYDLAGQMHHKDKRAETIKQMIKRHGVDGQHSWQVSKTALILLKQVRNQITTPYQLARRSLLWAIDLHEIGLSIAHNGFQKHSAYLVENSDMPGFSRQEQQLISFLVLNHRRKLRTFDSNYGVNADWGLVLIIRLACLLHRKRNEVTLPDNIKLEIHASTATLELPSDWLAEHPLTEEDLSQEVGYWEKRDYNFEIRRLG